LTGERDYVSVPLTAAAKPVRRLDVPVPVSTNAGGGPQ
jgi:hypothetical protein